MAASVGVAQTGGLVRLSGAAAVPVGAAQVAVLVIPVADGVALAVAAISAAVVPVIAGNKRLADVFK